MLWKVHVCLGGDFAGDHHQSGGGQRFAGDAAVGIFGEAGIQNRVGDLVCDFIRVAFRDRLRSETETFRA